MTLTLRIDNFSHLPDGGPVEYSVNQSGFEIGRDPGMDWTLPDPNRFVSSCHLEIRYENGGYWMYDVSTNGTFVNGGSMRVKSPYELQQGDRLQVGHYVVVAAIVGAAAQSSVAPDPAPSPSPAAFGGDIWSTGGAIPAAPDDFDPTPRSKERQPDFGDQHISVDNAFGGGFGGGGNRDSAPKPAESNPFGGPSSPFGESPKPSPSPTFESSGDSPFGAPQPATNDAPKPKPADAGSPFASAQNAPEQGSPFAPPKSEGARPPSGPASEGSPFGAPEHTKPPKLPDPEPAFAPPQPQQPQQPAARAPEQQTPAAEVFGAAPVARRPAPPAAQGSDAPSDAALLKAICEGAGMNPDALRGTDPLAVAHEIGQSLRIVAAELAGLLRARAAAKQMVKSGSRTMIGHDANNPMKFIPTAGEALEVMFGPGRPGYQRGAEAIQSSFNDVKKHQYAVHAAIQPALARLLADLSPEAIEDKIEGSRFSSKGAKAWDLFVERWDAKTHPYENGMLDVFLAYFADAYDDATEG